MRHIVLITPLFAINNEDSINVPFLQLFCRELMKREVELTIIAEKFPFGGNYLWNNTQVYTVKQGTPRALYKFLRRRKLNKVLERIHHQKKIDVIHNFWFNILGLISEEFANKNGIKHITTTAGQDVLPDNPYLKKIDTYSGKVFCLSPFHRHKLGEQSKVEARAISWGIEPIEYTETGRTIDLIICGWINAVKNHDQFLEIVRRLKETNSIKKAVICGGGPLFKELLANVSALQLNDVIEIKDSIPREQVLELMQKSKILVHTSKFESYGLVLAEGLACGCRVISSPVGIAWNNPDMVTCVSTQDFVTAIQQVLGGYRPPARVDLKKYLISNTVNGYLRVYDDLAS